MSNCHQCNEQGILKMYLVHKGLKAVRMWLCDKCAKDVDLC